MIVAVARKLAIALWRYVEHGLVPQGAILSPPITGNAR
jgi:transposase